MTEALTPGRRIGHYTIEAELGRGPIGISLRARDAGNEVVALKVLVTATPLTDTEKSHIANDFHTLADLGSPQIPPILEFVRYDDQYVIATDYLPLGNLGARLDRGPMPLAPALTLIRHLTYAVGRAHAAGLVHGAIKPANVLRREVDGRPVPVLADFGGALRAHRWTLPTGSVAAPDYLAPELVDGAIPTAAADVFALGTLLAAMAGPDAPTGVRDVIDRATRREPWDRYRNASEMLTDLTHLDGEAPLAVARHAVMAEPPMVAPVEVAPVEVAPVEVAPVEVAPAMEELAPVEEPPVVGAHRAEEPVEREHAAVFEPLPASVLAAAEEPRSARARLLTTDSVAAADRGYRSRLPLIGGVAAVAIVVLVVSLLLSGNKGSVFGGGVHTPAAPVVTASAGYRSVQFTFAQPSGDASVVEVRTGSTWTEVGSTSYAKPTAAGSQRACATFRVSDQSQTPAVSGPATTSCGTSAPPTLSVRFDNKDCHFQGFTQVCYALVAGGFQPGATHVLTLYLNGQVLGTVTLTADQTGHVNLPPGEHFHFANTAGGGLAEITYAGLKHTWLVSNV